MLSSRPLLTAAFTLLALTPASHSQRLDASTPSKTAETIDREIRADMAFLADDELHGRGSATRDEHLAALFAAAELQSLGLEPGGDGNTFLQKSPLPVSFSDRLAKRLDHFEDVPRTETWNAIAILRGTARPDEVILLTAHLDHLGMAKADPARSAGVADLIYNGADDDASGTTAVLTLARLLSAGQHPARTIVFALFGSEEIGGFGNRAFLQHPPVPIASIVANLEFEMIGRSDPAIAPDALWLTGFNRSDLGPALAQHGAHLVADPHPREEFFTRSDNYALARQGIIAHTVSSFGLHKEYHRPSDDLATIDFQHMTAVIMSMLAPVRWLADSDFRPVWNPGGRPAR